MKPIRLSFLLLIIFIIACSQKETSYIDLSGEWNVKLDVNNVDKIELIYAINKSDSITLPGSLRESGLGEKPTLETKWTGSIFDSSWYFRPDMEVYRTGDRIKFPFWLTPKTRFVGAAWYQKEINIPENWKDKSIILYLERPHWQTKAWIDKIPLGNQNSLSTPHIYTVTPGQIKPGKHLLTILVDNAIRDIDPGINSHSITDHTQGNWNGITGEMYLSARNQGYITSVKLNPDIDSKTVAAKVEFNNIPGNKNYKLAIEIDGVNHTHTITPKEFDFMLESSLLDIEISMGEDFKTWSEFAPNLYKIKISLKHENELIDTWTGSFGMRKFSVVEKRFEINDIPIFLRGTTDCCVFPLTGYPPTQEEEWTRIFDICKSYGLNHMRFHSYCPPEAAFIAADKAGIYLQVEGPSWAKYSVSLGNGKPIDQYLMDETKRIIDTYGNHPSFCMMAYGNEPSGNYVPYLENWVDHFRDYDPQRVFTGASTGRSWKIINNSDYIDRSPPRGLNWKNEQPQTLFDYRDKTEGQNRPYVTFEMGQWCAFPNFKEIDKYTGPLKALNFELFQQELAKSHMEDMANDFLMASGKLQAACYKQEIESTLRTPNLAGFQLLSLNDFSGQGTALVGVLDAFWDEKGYITANEFSSFCNSVVPLARIAKYTYLNSEVLDVDMEVANFCGNTLKDSEPIWQVVGADGRIADSGTLKKQDIPIGHCNQIGTLSLPLNFAVKAEKFSLKISVGEYTNQWDFWVYPDTNIKRDVANIHVCNKLDKEAKEILNQGGKVLLLAAGNVENGKDVVQYYTPVFWNTSWFRMRPPHTTGLYIQNEHPLFNDFPTDYYSDFQWWGLVNRSQCMNLENFPLDFKPIVQPIDTWFWNRRLASLFEAQVSKGRLIVCSLELNPKDGDKTVSDQLYNSIISYMQSEDFNNLSNNVDLSVIEELFEQKERKTWEAYFK